jgi:hypothetical protein
MFKVLHSVLILTSVVNTINGYFFDCKKTNGTLSCNEDFYGTSSNKSMTLVVKEECESNRTVWYCNTNYCQKRKYKTVTLPAVTATETVTQSVMGTVTATQTVTRSVMSTVTATQSVTRSVAGTVTETLTIIEPCTRNRDIVIPEPTPTEEPCEEVPEETRSVEVPEPTTVTEYSYSTVVPEETRSVEVPEPTTTMETSSTPCPESTVVPEETRSVEVPEPTTTMEYTFSTESTVVPEETRSVEVPTY